jgi:hypothetical protein
MKTLYTWSGVGFAWVAAIFMAAGPKWAPFVFSALTTTVVLWILAAQET